jgi:transcriptional regulator
MFRPIGQTPKGVATILTRRAPATVLRRLSCGDLIDSSGGCTIVERRLRGPHLYLPAHFEESRTDVLHALMRARPLATLVTLAESGIVANHIPIETLPDPLPHGMLRGHIARANPLWREYRADSEAVAIFQGPQAYISPSFYPSKLETGEVVPTWDYAVVHARGTLRFVQDSAWLRALVSRLTDAHEASRRVPWKVDDAPSRYIEQMLALIVGFELSIASLTGKWKLSQNHSAVNRLGVATGLRAAAGAEALEVADMLSSLEDERQAEPND